MEVSYSDDDCYQNNKMLLSWKAPFGSDIIEFLVSFYKIIPKTSVTQIDTKILEHDPNPLGVSRTKRGFWDHSKMIFLKNPTKPEHCGYSHSAVADIIVVTSNPAFDFFLIKHHSAELPKQLGLTDSHQMLRAQKCLILPFW